MIGPNYSQTVAFIINNDFGSVLLETSKWKYLNYTQYLEDDSLKFEGLIPILILFQNLRCSNYKMTQYSFTRRKNIIS